MAKQDFMQTRRDVLKGSTGLALGSLLLGGFSSVLEAKQTPKNASSKLHFPIRLNSNENSLGMSPKARQAVLDNLDDAFRYLTYGPNSHRTELIKLIANKFGFQEQNVVLGNGSSEVIQGAIYAFVSQARQAKKPVQIIAGDPTFEAASWYGKPLGVDIIKVPLNKKMELDIDTMQKKSQDFKGVSIAYICNPNNPTGSIASASKIQNWVKNAPEDVLFIFDEAYGEYAGSSFVSAMKYIKAGKSNVIVSKTFSKIYAIAGLRIGYGLGSAKIIQTIKGFMEVDNVNILGANAALASLKDKDFEEKSLQSNEASKKMLYDTLNEFKIAYIPTYANFVFYQIKGDLKTYQQRMKDEKIIVGREFLPLSSWNRISLGTPEEMSVFVSTLKKFRSKGWI